MSFLLALLLGWAIERAYITIAAWNYDSDYNGYGCIDAVNQKRALAPMSYRVLVPWIVYLAERIYPKLNRLVLYQAVKIALNTFAMWAVGTAWGVPTAIATAALLILTVKFDYWDWAAELGAVALAMTGNLPMAIIGAVVCGLSRETALILPVAFYLASSNISGAVMVGLAALITLAGVRLLVGKRKLYCKRFMLRENISSLKDFFKWIPFFQSEIFISVTLTALSIVSVLSLPTGWVIPLVFIAAGWSMALVNETRVFVVCLPWIAAMLVR